MGERARTPSQTVFLRCSIWDLPAATRILRPCLIGLKSHVKWQSRHLPKTHSSHPLAVEANSVIIAQLKRLAESAWIGSMSTGA